MAIETLEEFVRLVEEKQLHFDLKGQAIRYQAHCPITYLCERLCGESYDAEDVSEAQEELEIEDSVADKIINTADNEASSSSYFVPWLRERMLTWCKPRVSEAQHSYD